MPVSLVHLYRLDKKVVKRSAASLGGLDRLLRIRRCHISGLCGVVHVIWFHLVGTIKIELVDGDICGSSRSHLTSSQVSHDQLHVIRMPLWSPKNEGPAGDAASTANDLMALLSPDLCPTLTKQVADSVSRTPYRSQCGDHQGS